MSFLALGGYETRTKLTQSNYTFTVLLTELSIGTFSLGMSLNTTKSETPTRCYKVEQGFHYQVSKSTMKLPKSQHLLSVYYSLHPM